MRPVDFCEYYLNASLSFIFLSNSTLVLLLGIPYKERRFKGIFDLDDLIFGLGELVQIMTSSMIVVIVFFLFFCRVVPCWLSGIPKVVVFATLATLSMLGTYCLTTYGGRDAQCKLDLECHRRPDIDLPLTWLSTATSLTGVLVSYILHLYRNITRTWPCTENTRPRRLTTTVRTHPAKAPKSSNGNDHKGNWEEVLPRRPLPPRESSPTLLSSYVLRSVPLQKREMNKLGLTVITGIPMDSPFEFYQLEIPPKKRWRGRGRDAWERKPLKTSE